MMDESICNLSLTTDGFEAVLICVRYMDKRPQSSLVFSMDAHSHLYFFDD